MFAADLTTIPNKRYLTVTADAEDRWKQRFSHLRRQKVGLVWAGRPGLSIDQHRSLAPEQLERLLQADVDFVSLQVGQPCNELMLDVAAELHDWHETAAAMSALDLIISVDTATAHLAGAMHKDVWLLNRYNTCWRWMLDRDDTPWYPSMRIWRQPTLGDWSSVLNQVCTNLPHKG